MALAPWTKKWKTEQTLGVLCWSSHCERPRLAVAVLWQVSSMVNFSYTRPKGYITSNPNTTVMGRNDTSCKDDREAKVIGRVVTFP